MDETNLEVVKEWTTIRTHHTKRICSMVFVGYLSGFGVPWLYFAFCLPLLEPKSSFHGRYFSRSRMLVMCVVHFF